MNAYLLICKESLKAMRSVHAMVLCAVFVALNVLLGSFTIEIGKILEISFTSLAAAACSYCCGPFLGAIGGVAADLIKFMMRPSIFFIGFTFNELLLGLISGGIGHPGGTAGDRYDRIESDLDFPVAQYALWQRLVCGDPRMEKHLVVSD